MKETVDINMTEKERFEFKVEQGIDIVWHDDSCTIIDFKGTTDNKLQRVKAKLKGKKSKIQKNVNTFLLNP